MAYVVAAKWRARPGMEKRLAQLCEDMTEPSRAEPANLFYQAHRSPEDPRLFFLYEQYSDESGYHAHMDSEHSAALRERRSRAARGREREFFETL